MKKTMVVLASLYLAGCSATKLSSKGTTVIVTTEHKIPAKCKYVGQVVGNQGNFFTGAYTSNKNMAEGSMNDLRNQAGEMGANYVQLLTNQASGTGGGFDSSYQQTNVTNVGNAYVCPQNVIDDQTNG